MPKTFIQKIENCITSVFCFDCGIIKANVDKDKFDELLTNLHSTNNLKDIKASVMFQILVDSTGKGCVLSHTNNSEIPMSYISTMTFDNNDILYLAIRQRLVNVVKKK